MKKALVLGLALAFTPLTMQAQSTTATVTATAVILANLTVTPISNLTFGQLTQGAGTTILVGSPPAAPQSLGEFQIVHNSDVTVTIAAVPANLTGPAPSVIPVTLWCGYAATSGGGATAAACNALGTSAVATPGTDQSTFVQVGGVINGADTNVQAGTYTATLTFNITSVY